MQNDTGSIVFDSAYLSACIVCDLALLVWAFRAITSPTGPRGEELVIIYYWVVPIIMACPIFLAFRSWEKRFELSRTKIVLFNTPFALALLAWIWVVSLPT
jgi:hypothetical protein